MFAFQTSRSSRFRTGLTLLELVMVVSILAILTALVVPGMTDQSEQTRKTVATATMKELRDVIANRYLQDMQTLPQPNSNDGIRITAANLQADSSTTTVVPQMHFLFVNPNLYNAPGSSGSTTIQYAAVNQFDSQVRIGWNGPYVMIPATTYPSPAATRQIVANPITTGTATTTSPTWSDYGFTSMYGTAGDFCVNDPWGSPYVIVIQWVPFGGSTLYTANLVSAGFNRKLETVTGAATSTGDDLLLPIKSWTH